MSSNSNDNNKAGIYWNYFKYLSFCNIVLVNTGQAAAGWVADVVSSVIPKLVFAKSHLFIQAF